MQYIEQKTRSISFYKFAKSAVAPILTNDGQLSVNGNTAYDNQDAFDCCDHRYIVSRLDITTGIRTKTFVFQPTLLIPG